MPRFFYGARQYLWSRGLKQGFEVGELSDEEITAREDDKAQLIMTIEPELWRKVIKTDPNNRAAMLRMAETGSRSAVERFLSGF